MECCGHSSHKKMGNLASRVGCSLVIGLGVICCRLHCVGALPPFEDQVYNNVAKSFDRQLIRILPDLQKIIDQIGTRLYCGPAGGLEHNATDDCQKFKCLQAEDIFQHAGYLPGTEVLTPKTFAGVSVPLLAYALDPRLACLNNAPCLSRPLQDRLQCWIKHLLHGRTSLSENNLDHLIKNLTRNYRTNASTGKDEPFEAAEIFSTQLQVSPGSSVPSTQVPNLAALIVSKLFYGVPVTRTETSAAVFPGSRHANDSSHPTPEQFIQSLFDLDVEDRSALSLERLIDITKKLNIGDTNDHNHDHGHDHEHSHSTVKRHIGHHEETLPVGFNKTCFSLDDLRVSYNLVDKDLLTQDEFQKLCPALIQQAFYEACEPGPPVIEAKEQISDAQKYGYGTVAVLIVSLLSVLGIFFIPLFKKSVYDHALQGFIALGVGTLSGDALLHLLPEALGAHSHGAGEAIKEEHAQGDLVLWRCVTCLAAIYGFFLWEICLHSFIHNRSQRGKSGNHDHDHDHSHHEGHKHSHVPDPAIFARSRSTDSTGKGSDSKVSTDTELHVCSEEDVDKKHPPALVDSGDTFLGMSPLAWMVLLGDSLHNFGDGLTIAAAFSIDISSGISTTIAIFCHEVPHELGDFAIMLSTGMAFKKAMILNLLTGVACLGGFYIGIPIAQDEGARQWIFTVAAGMFLYVALADMLPELKNGAKNVTTIAVQNFGLLAGFAIMFLIAKFEDSIRI